jgi:hypothetical protein
MFIILIIAIFLIWYFDIFNVSKYYPMINSAVGGVFDYIYTTISDTVTCACNYVRSTTENYRSCRDCDVQIPPGGVAVINPFIMPYSGTSNINSLYSTMDKLDFGEPVGVSQSTPDHAELSN